MRAARRAPAAAVCTGLALAALAAVRAAPLLASEAATGEGSLAPQLTAATGGGAVLSWLEPDGPGAMALRFTEWRGSAWTAPRTVVSRTDLFVNWADVPSVLRLSSGRLAAHWLQRGATGTDAYDVRVATSTDEGATWSAALTPHRDGTASEHGFVSLAESAPGVLGLVWLDGRATMPAGGAVHGHGRAGVGAMTLRTAALRPDGTLADERELDARVCDCCPTAAVRTGDYLVIAYRDRGGQEVRDIAVVGRRAGRWSAPAVPHPDGWRIGACPVNGPALAADGQRVALAWFTAQGDDPRVSVAFSGDGGGTFGPAVRVSEGETLGRAGVVLLPGGDALVGWVAFAPGHSWFRVRRVTAGGRAGADIDIARVPAGRASGYPRLLRAGDRVIFAWTETSPTRRVRTSVRSLDEFAR